MNKNLISSMTGNFDTKNNISILRKYLQTKKIFTN